MRRVQVGVGFPSSTIKMGGEGIVFLQAVVGEVKGCL